MRIIAFLAVSTLVLLVSCQSPPPLSAMGGEDDRTQVVSFKKLFNARGGLHDLLLVTRDFREEMTLLEHTTILSYRAGKYTSL
ncbi:MAG: hypothetical protein ACYTFG_18945, partial [Planctomycetota bacterium]